MSYTPNYDVGDRIYLDGRHTVILGYEDEKYRLSKRGKMKWVDVREIDAEATNYNQPTNG